MDCVSEDEVAEFRNSGDFDEQWYVEQYPDVKVVGMDPARHYLWIGSRLGRRPSATSKPKVHAWHVASTSSTIEQSSAEETKKPVGVFAAIRRIRNAADSRTSPKTLTAELRSKIDQSGLFDSKYYKEEYEGIISDYSDLLADYIGCIRQDIFRDPGPLFSTKYYLETHKDVKDIHPFIHYVEYGMHECRSAFSPEKVNSFLESATNLKLNSFFEIVKNGRPINILYWSEGNFFFADVAKFLERLLAEHGYQVTVRTNLSGCSGDDALNIVVAPHEFCALGPGRDWTEEQFAEAVYVNTEQWQTSWFALSFKYIRRTRIGVLDLNPSSAQGLIKLGVKAAFLPLLPLPGSCFDFSRRQMISPHVAKLKLIEPLTYPSELHERPYDIVCCGVQNDRRAKALASMAPVLARHLSFIHVPRFNRPIKPGEPDVLSAEDFAQIARNSKIMMNVHQGASHYLEWQRVFLIGMMQGAVVVSEPCYNNSYVQPNVHFIESSIEDMPKVISDLLSTEDGRRKMNEIHNNVIELRKAIFDGERFL